MAIIKYYLKNKNTSIIQQSKNIVFYIAKLSHILRIKAYK